MKASKLKQVLIIAATATLTLGAGNAFAETTNQDVLIKFASQSQLRAFSARFAALNSRTGAAKIESLPLNGWTHVKGKVDLAKLRATPGVVNVQPNYKIHLLTDYRAKDPVLRAQIALDMKNGAHVFEMPADNPPLPAAGSGSGGTGPDPDYDKQWGMVDNDVKDSWGTFGGKGITVAVLDTGVDYTHEDLVDNLWRNPGEMGTDAKGSDKSSNGIDDDANGYIDDVIGWDFVSNDNKPFDLAVDPLQLLTGSGNPGHGTHCSGNVAARANNGKGTAGVAPEAKIMALRFISEKGEGDTAGAVSAINYAVKNGAKVLSNSWGSEGDDPADAAKNQALKDAITAAKNAGVLFIAAAGNGHQGVGYDNDTDPKPGVPASYNIENIISVAAIDSTDALGSFSNWGAKSVNIAAPGVKVFSTTVGGLYSDTVLDMYGIVVTWDGTSMATPHVAGAAALYWSKHPTATWQEVKAAILASAKPLPILNGKMTSGGKLNVERLMK